MGSFSWMFSDKKKQALDIGKSGYLLVPNNFQDKYGEGIYEEYYDGYGSFDKYDIFDLVIEWNKLWNISPFQMRKSIHFKQK